MIDKIIEFCAKNRALVIILTLIGVLIGVWAIRNIPLDAIPDLSDTQVIIYSRWDRSPDIVEDQVTYPIVTALLGAPKVKAVRGFSDFGFSYVYVIFQDGTDIYWARSRVLEYLSKITPRLPEGVKTELGPDASSLGWIFQYALVDTTGKHTLAELRSIQDWFLRYQLQAVPGVAEIATVGGFVKQYQVTVDPNALAAYNIPLPMVVDAIRKGNQEIGGRLLELSGAEYMIRGRGYVKSTTDIENIAVMSDPKSGTPVRIKNLGRVTIGPDIRRGVADLDGTGDVVSGIVIMRHQENALKVISRVKVKLKELEPSLPPGVQVITVYDRAELINRSIATVKHTLRDELIIVSLVILLFLFHIPSALIPIITLPIAVILSFIPMQAMHVSSNIMSLGGIAIAIGTMVDASIVVVENSHKRLEQWQREGKQGDYRPVLIKAIQEVGRSSFFSLLVIAVSFIPIFALEAQAGRLFRPLAFTKNFSISIAAVLAITLDPAIRMLFIRLREFRFRPKWLAAVVNAVFVGKIRSEEKHPISRFLFKLYHPVVQFVLRFPKSIILAAAVVVLATIPIFFKLGSEFMPPLDEGTILYMPTTFPGLSVTEAADLLQRQDKVLRSFPEVERVLGKAGRAETATDPAPFSMMETVVLLKPETEWRPVPRWYSRWAPEIVKKVLRHFWPDHISWEQLINEMDQKMQFPGVTNAWTMPVKARIDMLSTGIRTPIGIKIQGANLDTIETIGQHLEMILRDIKGSRSVYAERVAGGYYVDFDINREAIARYNLSVDDVQMIIMSAIGGENISSTVEGRERYPINVRYPRELRDNLPKLSRVLVPTPSGAQIPLGQLATIALVYGPSMLRDENGLLSGYVYVDIAGRDIGSYVREAKQAVRKQLVSPTGYSLVWSGQYEFMERTKSRLMLVVPLTLIIVMLLIYFNTRSVAKTLIVLLAVPFSLVGAVWLIYLLHYNVSTAVWVGIIALLGVDAETGIFMLLYLDLAYGDMRAQGRMRTKQDLKEAISEGAVKRLRPKMMTVATTFLGLAPIMWSIGTGADVMKRIAVPMIGGIFTSFTMELLVYPAIYLIWKWNTEMRKNKTLATDLPR